MKIKKKIEGLNNKKTDILEVGLKKYIKLKNIKYSTNLNDLNKCEIIFYSRDVNTNEKNVSNINYLRKDLLKINKKLIINKPIVILSQVYPGFTRSLGFKRKIYYQVETLIFGDAMERAINPERIIIGKKSKKEILPQTLKQIYQKFTKNILEMSYESAELSKISINLMLISSIMTSNMISLYCEKINANWPDIKRTLKMDKRIGKYAYLNPSPGLSGGNLERDLTNSLKLFNYKDLVKSWIELDNKMRSWSVDIVKNYIKKNNSILISGITYKDNTLSTKNSLAFYLNKKLQTNYKLTFFDNNVSFLKNFKNKIILEKKKLNKNFKCVIFVNSKNRPNFYIKNVTKDTIFIDPYGFFKDYFKNKKLTYFSIGNNK